MSRVIFKTIVSGSYELPYVLMNLHELHDMCDEFLITESNVTHTGTKKGFDFEDSFNQHIKGRFSRAKYIKMDIEKSAEIWKSNDKSDFKLRKNEFLTRSAFTEYIAPLHSRDIVISVDGDEVIKDSFLIRLIIWLLRLKRFGRYECFLLTLNHFMYFINLHIVNYDFYSPSLSHAGYYLQQREPHWRGGGRRIYRPVGCHFSWVMSPEKMTEKILRYSHRDRLAHLAKLEIMQSARLMRTNPMEPEIDFTSKEITSFRESIFPDSIKYVRDHIHSEMVICPQKFWS